MSQILDTWQFKVFAVSWIAVGILASVIYRKWQGKHILRPKFPNPLFEEFQTSGRSLRSLVTRLGGASNCLWVVVADGTLHVGAHFPFSLMFLPEFYGLEYHIPAENITAVERINSMFGRQKLRITVRRDLIGEESFEVVSKRPDDLVAALEEIRSKN